MLGVTSTSAGGRFIDDVASVPIKKRRITMVRSPSPPPEGIVANSDFSEIPGLAVADAAASTGMPGSVPRFLENGMSSGEFPQHEVAKVPPVNVHENQQQGQLGMNTRTEEDYREQTEMLMNAHAIEGNASCRNLHEPEGHLNAECEEMAESTELALGCNPAGGGFGNDPVQMLPCPPADREKKEKGMLLRLDSGYFNDDRSRWDLNTPMDSWEKQPGVLDADSGLDSAAKGLAESSCKKSLEILDGIQVHILDVEVEGKIREGEEDMLGRGFQADQSADDLGLDSEEDAELDTCLGLQPDLFSSRPCATGRKQGKYASVPKSDARFGESLAERGLNLSIAPFEGSCCSSNGGSTFQTEDGKHWRQKLPGDSLETHHLLQSDRCGSKVCASDNIKYSVQKNDEQLLKDNLDAIDGICAKENSSGFLATNDHLDGVFKSPVSSPAKDQHLTGTMDEDRVGHDANIVAVCKADALVSVEDTDTTGERQASPEDVLNKQSTEYATEVAYAGDYEYDDEDEPVSDTEKGFVGQMEDGCQGEGGEHRETEFCNWDEDDAGEEMEVEHVDYGDSDCRDADDLGIDPDDRGKGVEFMDAKDVMRERNWKFGQQSEMEQQNCDIRHDSQFGEAFQVGLDGENTKADETESAVIDMEQGTMKDKGDGTDPNSAKPLHENKGTDAEVELNFNRDQHEAGAMPTERKCSTLSKQKSSGWDQLPEGFENAEEALKAVKDIITKQGRGTTWVSHNVRVPRRQMGPISSRGSFSRMNGRFRERVHTDDLMHGNEEFYTWGGREGSLCTSPRFASRKPGRGRSVGRSGSSPGMHARGRGDPWMDSATGHWDPNGHHSPPDHYGGQDCFGPRVSTNAAAVSAAKVESNGFAVALDGTLTKTGRGGMHGRRGRGTLMRRGTPMDIEEGMDFGMPLGMGPRRVTNMGDERVDTNGHGKEKRYQGPSFFHSRWDMSVGNSPRMSMHSMDQHLTAGNRSFSLRPRRGLAYRISQSRSRSRTRSPRLRSSSRGSAIVRTGRRTTPRRHTRSPPALRSEARPLFHRVESLGHRLSFLASSGSRRSPPQVSKWSNDRRDVDHFRDSDYKRPFVHSRSPSRRLTPHGVHESCLMDSLGRLKRREYCGPMHSCRSSEFGTDSRSFKHEENQNVRLKQIHSSGRSAEIGGLDVRRFRHQDDGDDCQAHSSRGKDTGASREKGGETPMASDRGREPHNRYLQKG